MTSPCQNICNLDPILNVCMTCKRTLQEIEDWSSYTQTERKAIMKKVKERNILTKNEKCGIIVEQ
jgi:uncharacterized protein